MILGFSLFIVHRENRDILNHDIEPPVIEINLYLFWLTNNTYLEQVGDVLNNPFKPEF